MKMATVHIPAQIVIKMNKFKAWCNICDRETDRDKDSKFDGQCPWHNIVIQDEEGSHLAYDEFPQDGYGEDY